MGDIFYEYIYEYKSVSTALLLLLLLLEILLRNFVLHKSVLCSFIARFHPFVNGSQHSPRDLSMD